MKYVLYRGALTLFFVVYGAQFQECDSLFTVMQSTSGYIAQNKSDTVHTRGFALPLEDISCAEIQLRGICYGTGKHGAHMATTTARFLQNALSLNATLLRHDLGFMETMGIPGEFTSYLNILFQNARKHVLQKSPQDLEGSCCQTAFIYHNAYLNYMALVQIGKDSMIAYEGMKDPLPIVHEGGLEQGVNISICSFMENLPRSILIGAPQVVKFLLPHLATCREHYRVTDLSHTITARDLWEYVKKEHSFSGDFTNAGDFQLLTKIGN